MPANREFLPGRAARKARTAEQIAAAAPTGLDFPVTQVGVAGNITVDYDTALGQPGLQLAQQMVNAVSIPYSDMETFFGITGGPVTVVIAPLSGSNDGSGGAYHYGCDFASGGTLYLDATFSNTTINPLDLEVALYVAELSEAFMGAQNRGWGCGYSNGEGLSRFYAEDDTPPGSFPNWGVTGPSWAQAGFPDWVTKTEQTDRNYVSTGCAIVYIYWMRLLGFDNAQIASAGGATLSANYQTLTGKPTALQDLLAATKGLTITSDNPFTPVPAGKWNINDLTAATSAVATAGDPAGYMFNAQGTQHVVYRGTDGHIHELWWDSNGWHTNDLTAATSAVAAAGDPAGYMFNAQGTQHVVYRGTDSHVHELWWG